MRATKLPTWLPLGAQGMFPEPLTFSSSASRAASGQLVSPVLPTELNRVKVLPVPMARPEGSSHRQLRQTPRSGPGEREGNDTADASLSELVDRLAN